MKKTLSFLLAAALMAAMAVPAFADEVATDKVTGDTSATVTASYAEGDVNTDVATVYSVTIAWATGGDLTYTEGDTSYTWNPDSTAYEASTTDPGWSGEATVTITVTNKSNASITATAAWVGEDELTTDCQFTGSGNVIASAAANTDLEGAEKVLQGAPVNGEIGAIVTVTDGAIEENGATVGTITVTISK